MPEQYQHHLGNAWACPEHWSDEDAAATQLEAMGVAFLGGPRCPRRCRSAPESRRSWLRPDEGLRLNRQRQLLRDSTQARQERAAKARAVEDIDKLDELQAAAKEARPIAGLDPPGTGKTTVVGNCVDQEQAPDSGRGHLRRSVLALEKEGKHLD